MHYQDKAIERARLDKIANEARRGEPRLQPGDAGSGAQNRAAERRRRRPACGSARAAQRAADDGAARPSEARSPEVVVTQGAGAQKRARTPDLEPAIPGHRSQPAA